MNQGEVWTLDNGLRVLIVSNDSFNELGMDPVCVPLVRQRGEENDLVIFTGDADHVSGMFLLPEISPRVLTGGKRESLITGTTMAKVSRKLAELFAH